jgi:hypothetical protein
MRRRYSLVIVALALVAGVASLLPAQDPPKPAGAAWEYRVVLLTDVASLQQKPAEMTAALESKFNDLGKDGWEIAENINGGIVFKRRPK